MPTSDYIHKKSTVIVGDDTEANTTVIFVLKPSGEAFVVSFPRSMGRAQLLSPKEMEQFLEVTSDSEMLAFIKEAWKELRPS